MAWRAASTNRGMEHGKRAPTGGSRGVCLDGNCIAHPHLAWPIQCMPSSRVVSRDPGRSPPALGTTGDRSSASQRRYFLTLWSANLGHISTRVLSHSAFNSTHYGVILHHPPHHLRWPCPLPQESTMGRTVAREELQEPIR